jgi:long-subunit acyl-CoA synthetase (AMP-forming)
MPALPDPVPRPLDHLADRGRDGDPALVLRGEALNYKALRTRVGQLAAWLAAQVPDPGARVASWAAKGELTCLLPLATARAGLVHVTINPLLNRAQVAHILADSGAKLMVGTRARLDTLENGDVPEGCTILEEPAAIEASRNAGVMGPSDADTGALAAILYTSGSTGKPKGVMLSHANLWLGAVSVAHYLGLERDDVVLAVLPLSFD